MLLPRRGPVAIPYDPDNDPPDATVGGRLARRGVSADRALELFGEDRITLDGNPVHAFGQPAENDTLLEVDVAHDGELT